MTYRCIDCVYSKIIDKNSCEMSCLKYDRTVWCMENCCESLILKPYLFLSHLIYSYHKKHGKKCTWWESDDKAKTILKEYGFYGMSWRINEYEDKL